MADPTATPRTFTKEELSKMDPLVRESILAALAIINATPTPTPVPKKNTNTPTPTPRPDGKWEKPSTLEGVVGALVGKKAPPRWVTNTPTPTTTMPGQVEGVDFVYNEYGDVVTPNDPEFGNYVKLWRARVQAGKE